MAPPGSFLEHVYGESGKGPDEDLIQMLERDVVKESSVSVSFDDIAGLKQVKGLLEEAAVLPVMIPNYFKGIRRICILWYIHFMPHESMRKGSTFAKNDDGPCYPLVCLPL